MATIGIIGSGNIGRNVAIAALRSGHAIVLANSRGPESLSPLVAKLGSKAQAATALDAAAAGDFAVVATPLPAVVDIPVEPLNGKVVLTSINYLPEWYGHVTALDEWKTTTPEILQAHLPSSRVVRAFNMISAAEINTASRPVGDPARRALALAGDDAEAKQLVEKLYVQFGFDAFDIGPLSESWRLDPGQPAFVTPQSLEQLKANVAGATKHLRTTGWAPPRQQ